jgi:hypothetical protein
MNPDLRWGFTSNGNFRTTSSNGWNFHSISSAAVCASSARWGLSFLDRSNSELKACQSDSLGSIYASNCIVSRILPVVQICCCRCSDGDTAEGYCNTFARQRPVIV